MRVPSYGDNYRVKGEDIKKNQTILFDRVAGFPTEFEEKIYKVINVRDVVAVL